jgi:hypothetical protein
LKSIAVGIFLRGLQKVDLLDVTPDEFFYIILPAGVTRNIKPV